MIHLSSMRFRFRGLSKEDQEAIVKEYQRTSRSGSVESYLKESDWWIHEGDLRLPANVVNNINLIVKGDLIIDGWYDDYQGEGLLAVFGSMRCRHVFSWYAIYVAHDMLVSGLNLQYYNDWVFECGGQLAGRAFIVLDKACEFDCERMELEGFYSGRAFPGPQSSLKPFKMLGMLDEAHDEDDEDDDSDWLPDFHELLNHVKTAEAEGRSPFVTPESPPSTIWREALYPETTRERLTELAVSHGWDVAMRPNLQPELQNLLAGHADPRVRWALASSPGVEDAALLRLAADTHSVVRAAVASHERCPDGLWEHFASDTAPDVRAAVVHAHGSGPAAWVISLAGDASALVRRAVAAIPGLPAEVIAALLNDADTRVKNRTLCMQQQSPDVIRAQFDSPDEGVRLGLAQAAAYGNRPFSREAADHGLRKEALMHFMLDASARVREAAAVGFLAPSFYDANAQQFALDELAKVRCLFAYNTRQSDWLAKLATDDDDSVREAVSENPNTPADTLRQMAEAVMPITFGSSGSARAAGALLENPRLPADAVTLIYKAYPRGHDIGPHPNAPAEVMVRRICDDTSWSADDPEYPIHQRCLRVFADDTQPSAQKLDALFRYIVKAKPYKLCALFRYMVNAKPSELCAHALGNAACPPDILARHTARYLRKKDKDGCYEMKGVAANPALPIGTMRKLTGHLLERQDHAIKKGLFRNPAFPADLLAALAIDAKDQDCRRDACAALWLWHGITEENIPNVPPACLDGFE